MENIEIWKPIKNYEGKYEVSNLGHFRDAYLHDRSVIFPKDFHKGRGHVELYKEGVRHDLDAACVVAESFLNVEYGNSVIFFLDDDPTNLIVDNLSTDVNVWLSSISIDFEVWKLIPGYEDCYAISNLGRLASLPRLIPHSRLGHQMRRGKLKEYPTSEKYKNWITVQLWKNGKAEQFPIHQLVAKCFLPNPDNLPFINHIDGNPSNNRVSNLEWCTPKENYDHAIRTGLLVPQDVWMGKKVIDTETGIVYSSISRCAKELGIGHGSVVEACNRYPMKYRGHQLQWEVRSNE